MAIIKKQNSKSSGFALIFVVAFMGLILTVIGDIIYQTQIVAKNTMRSADQIDAEATALTGVSVAKMLINLHVIKENKFQKTFPLEVPLYSILNGKPLSHGILAGFGDIVNPNVIAAFAPVKGELFVNVTSENSKLNLNLLSDVSVVVDDPDPKKFPPILSALCNIFSTPDSIEVLKLHGNLNASTLVTNLTKYLRKSQSDIQPIRCPSVQDSTYYPPQGDNIPMFKKGPLISLEELRRIPGFNYDDIYSMYAPYFTVWPIKFDNQKMLDEAKMNISTVPIELLASILPPINSTEGINDSQLLWRFIDEYRTANVATLSSQSANDITTWLKGLDDWLKTKNQGPDGWKFNNDTRGPMLRNLFGAKDSVYLIESRGMVNTVDRTLLVAVKSLTAPSGANIDNKKNMDILYSQWTNSVYPNIKPFTGL